MLESFLVVVGNVVTLFLLMGVGFVLARREQLRPDGVAQMSYVTLYVVTPCVIISSFQGASVGDLGVRLLQFAGVYGGATVVNMLLGARAFSYETEARRGPMRFSLVYGNNGFMGLPLLEGVLGSASVIYGVVSVVIFNFCLWTHGVKTMGGRVTLRQVLVNPATVGLAVALPLFLSGLRLPDMVGRAVGFLGNLNTPLAMLVIGAQMARADLRASFTSLRLYRGVAYRLLLSPLIPLLLLLPLGLDPLLYQSCVIMCAVPVAGATGMLAQRFARDTAVAAQMVTLSTLLSVITLPILAVTAKLLAGL